METKAKYTKKRRRAAKKAVRTALALLLAAIVTLGGIFAAKKNGLIKGYIFGIFCRYICAVLSGVIFFGEYAPEGFNAFTWSIWYNFTYVAVEGAISVALLCIPQVKHMFERLRASLD